MIFYLFLFISSSNSPNNEDFNKIGYIQCKGKDNGKDFAYYCLIDEVCDSDNKCRKLPEIVKDPKYFYLIWFVILCIELCYFLILGWNRKTWHFGTILLFALDQLSNFIGWTLIFFLAAVKFNLLYIIGIIAFVPAFIILFFIRRKLIVRNSYNDFNTNFSRTILDQEGIKTDFVVTSVEVKTQNGKDLVLVKNAIYIVTYNIIILTSDCKVTKITKCFRCIYEPSTYVVVLLWSDLIYYLVLFFGFDSFYCFFDNSDDKIASSKPEITIVKEEIDKKDERKKIPKPNFDLCFSQFKYKRYK